MTGSFYLFGLDLDECVPSKLNFVYARLHGTILDSLCPLNLEIGYQMAMPGISEY